MSASLVREMVREVSGRVACFVRGLHQPTSETNYSAVILGKEIRFTHSRFNPAWLSSLGVEPQVILDIGSFDGGDAYRFSQAFPRARVLSVEADPYRFKYVSDRLVGTQVEVIHAAVCETDGTVDWFAADEGRDAQGSIYRHTDAYKQRFPQVKQATHSERVTSERLDTLCRTRGVGGVSLLHMDVEGAEYAALSGIGDLRPTLIWAELCDGRFEGAQSVANTRRLLKHLGYKPVIHLRHDSLYRFSHA
jgi:FkbM family methyltransferase